MAGSGKKRAQGQLTFNRDWLAGSGKRSSQEGEGEEGEAEAAAVASSAQVMDMLLDYLYLQAPVTAILLNRVFPQNNIIYYFLQSLPARHRLAQIKSAMGHN